MKNLSEEVDKISKAHRANCEVYSKASKLNVNYPYDCKACTLIEMVDKLRNDIEPMKKIYDSVRYVVRR